jgi:glycosyltransferase involved in cell wall biosynthesis
VQQTPAVSPAVRLRALVVIPAKNEASTIARTVADVAAAGWPVIVVDDGSDDGTGELARRAGATVLRHTLNLGQGAALQTGISWACSAGADYVVTFDADGQHDAADIRPLVEALLAGADVALGSRFLGRTEGATFGRRLVLRASVFVSNRISGTSLTDAHCGLRAFTAEAARGLRITQNGMAHASQILSHIHKAGLRAAEVPVTVRYTDYSRHKGQGAIQALRILFDLFFRAG